VRASNDWLTKSASLSAKLRLQPSTSCSLDRSRSSPESSEERQLSNSGLDEECEEATDLMEASCERSKVVFILFSRCEKGVFFLDG